MAAGNTIHVIDTVNSSDPTLLFTEEENSMEVLMFCNLISNASEDVISLAASTKSKEGLTLFVGTALDGVTVYRAVDRSKLKWVGGVKLGE